MVAIETLDDVLEGKHPVLMKMDVEGYEPEVLKGAEATLREEAPTVLTSAGQI